ncbi:hypothetical protein HY990_02265 [Candidatus Micrarchaeota archaeon]|nr:hypothetical protein [Candidatus Micrarchaeota archaeon]
MGSTAKNVGLFIVSAALGAGVTLLGTSLIPGLSDMIRLGIGILITLSLFVSLSAITKSNS